MIKIPEGSQPFQPPLVTPKDLGKKEAVDRQTPAKINPESVKGESRDITALDSHSMAVRLAALAREVETETMFRIIQRAIEKTGLNNPQAAMEEINRRLQKAIDKELDNIKNNKELMEEAGAWQDLADILEREMTEEQAKTFADVLEGYIKKS